MPHPKRRRRSPGAAENVQARPLQKPGIRALLRSCIDSPSNPTEVTVEALSSNWKQLKAAVDSGAIDFGGNIDQKRLFDVMCEVARDGIPSADLLVTVLENEPGPTEELKDVQAERRVWTRSNFAFALNQEAAYCKRIRFAALLKEAATLPEDAAFELMASRRADFRDTTAALPTKDDPLAGLTALGPLAVRGRERILALAAKPIHYIWNRIAERGSTVVLGASPGGGKTSLLFWIIAARCNVGEPVPVLGQLVTPAPEDRFVVVIEEEHQDESTARLLVRACQRAAIDDAALERVIYVSRKGVTIGSPAWDDVGKIIAAGLVSDVVLDTLARVGPGDSNDEQAQVAVFNAINKAIESAPSADAKPTFWVAAHVRKTGEGLPTIQDISGSTQRAGAVDVVITMAAKRVDGGNVDSVRVGFPKVREQDAEDALGIVEFRQTKAAYEIVGTPGTTNGGGEGGTLKDRVIVELASGPLTANQLSTRTTRSNADIQEVITALFAEKRLRTVMLPVRGKDRKHFELVAETPATSSIPSPEDVDYIMGAAQ